MDQWKRRAIGYFAFVTLALLLTAFGYQWGMAVFEGRPRTFLDSIQFAVEMFTTTGFGGDAPWQSPEMNVFIAVTDLLGMAILVGALPVLVGPLLENALATTAPQEVETSVNDHVVICSDTTRAEALIEELEAHSVPFVIVEPDRDRADELYEDDYRVIRTDPESTDGLEAARLPAARALFVDVSDEIDASIVLAAKEVADDVPVVSVVEQPEMERYIRLAGADHVISPRSLLGESLAAKVTTAVQTELNEAITIGDSLQLAEISIRHGSDLAGSKLADSGIRERSGVNVIGAWTRGEFHPAPDGDIRLIAGSVLLVSGRPDQLEALVEMTQSSVRQFQAGQTVVIGYGEVGQAVCTQLNDAEISYTVVDRVDMDGVDVVGEATDPETLRAANIEEATTVVLALPDDTTTEFATLVIRDLASDTEIIARIGEKENVSKMYRAGSDYVLSLVTVSGRMAAERLLDDRDVLSLNQQVEVIRTSVPSLSGQSIGDVDIRAKTGCTVVAIERDSEVLTDLGPETTIEPGDELLIVGTDDEIHAFEQSYGSSVDSAGE
ncbi:MAG: TrkA family potassium uptake protein [Halobacteriales archaeon]